MSQKKWVMERGGVLFLLLRDHAQNIYGDSTKVPQPFKPTQLMYCAFEKNGKWDALCEPTTNIKKALDAIPKPQINYINKNIPL